MQKHWRQDALDRLTNLDVDKLRDECRNEAEKEDTGYDGTYPRLCGALGYHIGEAQKLAAALMKELQEKLLKIRAMEWAAETVLKGREVDTYDDRVEVYEILYQAAEIIEKAMAEGMSDSDLRKHLKDGITDEEYKQGRLLDEDEICKDCDEFCGKEAERCELCQEVFEEANSQEA